MSPVLLSLIVASSATVLAALVAIPLAHRLSRAHFRGQSAIETILTLPLVLPPTVVGYALVVLFGARGLLGSWLSDAFGYTPLFRVEGAVLAAAVVSFPLLYLPAKSAFRAIDPQMIEMAALLGASRTQTFWHVSLPVAANGIYGGIALCFARALGEFGATVMVFGWNPGRLTMPIAVYSAYEQGDMSRALPIVLVLIGICFVLLALINRASVRSET